MHNYSGQLKDSCRNDYFGYAVNENFGMRNSFFFKAKGTGICLIRGTKFKDYLTGQVYHLRKQLYPIAHQHANDLQPLLTSKLINRYINVGAFFGSNLVIDELRINNMYGIFLMGIVQYYIDGRTFRIPPIRPYDYNSDIRVDFCQILNQENILPRIIGFSFCH